jgi:hypothetical protein
MLGLDELRDLAVDPGLGIDQVLRVELVAAVVALVAARAGVTADRAGALDEPVGQGAPGRRRDRPRCGLLDQVTVAVDDAEQLLRHMVVIARGGAGEQVVAQPERGEIFDDHPVVLVGELLGGQPLRLRLDQDGGAVLVRPADHEHVVTGHPHIAAEDVGGHSEPRNMADVSRAVGVGPGHRGENVTHSQSA